MSGLGLEQISPSDLVVVPIANPGAGQLWRARVPGEFTWIVYAITFLLTTDATAGNRFPSISYDDGQNNYMYVVANAPQAGSQNVIYGFGMALGYSTTPVTGGYASASLPYLLMAPGHRVGIPAMNLQPGDAITAIRLLVLQKSTRVQDVAQPAFVTPRPAEIALG